jgi:hypothetical protein
MVFRSKGRVKDEMESKGTHEYGWHGRPRRPRLLYSFDLRVSSMLFPLPKMLVMQKIISFPKFHEMVTYLKVTFY